MLTHEKAQALLARRSPKKLGHNTWLVPSEVVWLQVRGAVFAVRYHQTEIISLLANGSYVVDTHGFRTSTTKQRINKYSPARIWQVGGVWWVHWGSRAIPYEDGMAWNKEGKLDLEASQTVATHVWLSAPSSKKAEQLRVGFRHARKNGATGEQARAFAGYYCERLLQGGHETSLEGLLNQATYKRGPGRMACLQRAEYTLTFFRHNRYWLEGVNITTNPEVAEMATSLYDGDWAPLYDRLLDLGYAEQAEWYVP